MGNILLVGATGKQGRSFIQAVLRSEPSSADDSTNPIHIIALTRNPNSEAAKSLLSRYSTEEKARVTLVQGDLNDSQRMRELFVHHTKEGGIWGVFAILAFPGLGKDASIEEKQGKTLIDLSVEHQVSHFIFSSADRASEAYEYSANENTDTGAKRRIEEHLRIQKKIKWSIVRPGFFMENFNGMIGRITFSVLRNGLKPDTKLDLIAAEDIGSVVKVMFDHFDEYNEKTTPIYGDCLTLKQVEESFLRGCGGPMPSIPAFMGRIITGLNSLTKQVIAEIERAHARRSNAVAHGEETREDSISRCREMHPSLLTLETWARKKKEHGNELGGDGTNGVTLWKLMLGKS